MNEAYPGRQFQKCIQGFHCSQETRSGFVFWVFLAMIAAAILLCAPPQLLVQLLQPDRRPFAPQNSSSPSPSAVRASLIVSELPLNRMNHHPLMAGFMIGWCQAKRFFVG